MAKAEGSKQGKKREFPLSTQKDGRRFAVEILERLARVNTDEATAVPFNDKPDELTGNDYYRTGPQWDGLYQALSMLLKEGNDEAVKGFASVLTDCFAGNVNMDIDSYREYEAAGLMQDFGKPGTDLPLPQIGARAMRA